MERTEEQKKQAEEEDGQRIRSRWGRWQAQAGRLQEEPSSQQPEQALQGKSDSGPKAKATCEPAVPVAGLGLPASAQTAPASPASATFALQRNGAVSYQREKQSNEDAPCNAACCASSCLRCSAMAACCCSMAWSTTGPGPVGPPGPVATPAPGPVNTTCCCCCGGGPATITTCCGGGACCTTTTCTRIDKRHVRPFGQTHWIPERRRLLSCLAPCPPATTKQTQERGRTRITQSNMPGTHHCGHLFELALVLAGRGRAHERTAARQRLHLLQLRLHRLPGGTQNSRQTRLSRPNSDNNADSRECCTSCRIRRPAWAPRPASPWPAAKCACS